MVECTCQYTPRGPISLASRQGMDCTCRSLLVAALMVCLPGARHSLTRLSARICRSPCGCTCADTRCCQSAAWHRGPGIGQSLEDRIQAAWQTLGVTKEGCACAAMQERCCLTWSMLSSTSSCMRRVSTVPEKPLSLTSITVSPIDSTCETDEAHSAPRPPCMGSLRPP